MEGFFRVFRIPCVEELVTGGQQHLGIGRTGLLGREERLGGAAGIAVELAQVCVPQQDFGVAGMSVSSLGRDSQGVVAPARQIQHAGQLEIGLWRGGTFGKEPDDIAQRILGVLGLLRGPAGFCKHEEDCVIAVTGGSRLKTGLEQRDGGLVIAALQGHAPQRGTGVGPQTAVGIRMGDPREKRFAFALPAEADHGLPEEQRAVCGLRRSGKGLDQMLEMRGGFGVASGVEGQTARAKKQLGPVGQVGVFGEELVVHVAGRKQDPGALIEGGLPLQDFRRPRMRRSLFEERVDVTVDNFNLELSGLGRQGPVGGFEPQQFGLGP